MNKDNRKLTELYQVIKEAFEPDTSPESNVSGPAKELFNLLKEIADDTIKEITNEYAHQSTKTLVFDFLNDNIDKIISKAANNGYESFLHYYDGDPSEGVEIDDGEEYAIAPAFGTDAVDVGYEMILDAIINAIGGMYVCIRSYEKLYEFLKHNFNERLDVKTLEQVLTVRDTQ